MTICSRLRTEEMAAAGSGSPSSVGSSDSAFESFEMRRMNTALAELGSCCRTTLALQSFEVFEAQLKNKSCIPARANPSSVDGTTDVDSEMGLTMRRVQRRRVQAYSSPQQMQVAKDGLRLLTPTKPEPPLPNIWSRLALPKSKTTSNLLSLQSASAPRLPTPTALRPKPGEWLSPYHARRVSGHPPTPERKSEIMKDVRHLVRTPARIVQQRMSASRTPAYGSNVSSSSEVRRLTSSKTMPHLRKPSSTTPITKPLPVAMLKEFDKVSDSLSCASLETGCPPPPPRRAKSPEAATKMVNGGKVLKSRRRSERKSSGEMIKGVFDAGMKQMKQMGKRVGGSMSWVGSQEDLTINVLASGAR